MLHSIFTWFLLVHSVALLEASAPLNEDNLLGVFFDPYVGPQDGWNRYDEADTISLLSKVSSRFSTIMAGDIALPQDCDYPSCSLVHIPTAAATFNKLYRSIGQSPLEVLLQFEDVAKARGTNLSHFDFIHALAHKANSIYSGTVTTLLFYIKPETSVTLDNAIKVFNSTSKQLSPDKEHLKLGALLPFSYCEQWSSDLTEMLGYLHVVIFEKLPTDEDLKMGAESTFQLFSQGFEECSKRVKGLNESIQVGYKTGWPDTNGDGVQNIPDFVRFWERMEKWAKMQRTRVVMYEAFDMPWEYSFEMRSYGWWRLIASRSYSNVSQFMFQEKKEAASKMKTQDVPLKEEDTIDVTTITLGGMAIGLLLLVFLAIAIVILYKRVSSRLMTGQSVQLTSKELEEFFEGNNCGYTPEPGTNLNVPGMAYSKDLEIPAGSFTINESSILGVGTFGAVFLGSVKEKEVAVKTAKPSCPSTALKGLLSEIKVLSWLGSHKNVTCIVGAHTAELFKGKVYVFIELCRLGSLDKILRAYKSTETEDEEQVSCEELCRWSYEIACGMEFLSSKQIVHADLATRNVLITENERTAKVSDFGLSRRLYDYTNYVKTQQEPLPWRWMAPEALNRLEFSEKTDAWAFGVTLWEIFSLGDIPYPGLSWSLDFVTRIEQGLKLNQPQLATEHVYSMMMWCWLLDSHRRPTFAELRTSLYNFSDNYDCCVEPNDNLDTLLIST